MIIRHILLLLLVVVVIVETKEVKINDRSLQTASSIRIILDFETMDTKYRNDPTLYKYIGCKKVTIKAVELLTKLLKVRLPKPSQEIPFLKYQKFKIQPRTIQGDLLVSVSIQNIFSPNWPRGTPLAFDSVSGRPTAGILEFDMNYIYPTREGFLENFIVPLQGIYQILVFNDILFDKFVDSNNKVIGRNNLIATVQLNNKLRQGYRGPKVIERAKAHLNDPNLQWLLFEESSDVLNQNIRWDFRYFPDDMMSHQNKMYRRISDVSLAMALDSGWYEVDMDKSQKLIYSKDIGANFQTGKCPPENLRKGFCSAGDEYLELPSQGYYGKQYCSIINNSGCYQMKVFKWCPTNDPLYNPTWYDFNVEYFGLGSRSINYMWKEASATDWSRAVYCGLASCSPDGTVIFTFKNGVVCSCDSGTLGSYGACSGYSSSEITIEIQCPLDAQDATILCDGLKAENNCPDDCSGNGICLGSEAGKKECHCLYGFTGHNCATVLSEENDEALKPWLIAVTNDRASMSLLLLDLPLWVVCYLIALIT